MSKTKIPWATDVWNPTVGCTKVSAGCKNCYAERIFERFHPGEKFSNVHYLPGKIDDPLYWKRPRRIFVDSMSDLFHRSIDQPTIAKVFAIMAVARWHTYMILTKRPERMIDILGNLAFDKDIELWQEQICFEQGWCSQDFEYPLPNVWLGVSVEDQKTADERIQLLLQTPAAVRFVSVEPMLEEVDLDKYEFLCETWSKGGITIGTYLDWVIAGCESGPGARPMDLDWARSLRDQCQAASAPFFLKQAQIDGKLVKMPELDGKVWDEYPIKEKR